MEFTRRDTKIIKGVAICLMLYHHLFAFPNRITDGNVFISLMTFGETTLSTYIGQFAWVCVPMFVFLGGFGVYLNSLYSGDLQQKTAKHIVELYKSYWKVFFIFVPISILFFDIRPDPVQRELIYNFLGLSYSFNGEWWFIVPYVILLILFPAIKNFLDRKNSNVFTDIFWVISLNALVMYVLPELTKLEIFLPLCSTVLWTHMEVMLELLPGFILGCIFAKYSLLEKIKTHLGAKPQFCLAAIIVAAAVFYIHLYNHMTYNFIDAAVFICCLTVFLPSKPGQWAGKVFEILGEESTFMWLTHSFFCYYWCQKLVFAPKYSIVIFLWLLALSFASAKLIRFVYKYLGIFYKHIFKTAQKNTP